MHGEGGLRRQDLDRVEAAVRLEICRDVADRILRTKSFLDLGKGPLEFACCFRFKNVAASPAREQFEDSLPFWVTQAQVVRAQREDHRVGGKSGALGVVE